MTSIILRGDYQINKEKTQPHEANLLKLDCSKSHNVLHWNNVWDADKTFEKTVLWYKSYYKDSNGILTKDNLNSYINDGMEKGIEWAIN